MKKQKYFSGGGGSNELVLCKNSKTIFTINFYSKAKGSLRLLQISSISGFPIEKKREMLAYWTAPYNVISYAELHIISWPLHIKEWLRRRGSYPLKREWCFLMQLFLNLMFKPGEYIFGTNILPLVHSGKRESFIITLSHFWPNI